MFMLIDELTIKEQSPNDTLSIIIFNKIKPQVTFNKRMIIKKTLKGNIFKLLKKKMIFNDKVQLVPALNILNF